MTGRIGWASVVAGIVGMWVTLPITIPNYFLTYFKDAILTTFFYIAFYCFIIYIILQIHFYIVSTESNICDITYLFQSSLYFRFAGITINPTNVNCPIIGSFNFENDKSCAVRTTGNHHPFIIHPVTHNRTNL